MGGQIPAHKMALLQPPVGFLPESNPGSTRAASLDQYHLCAEAVPMGTPAHGVTHYAAGFRPIKTAVVHYQTGAVGTRDNLETLLLTVAFVFHVTRCTFCLVLHNTAQTLPIVPTHLIPLSLGWIQGSKARAGPNSTLLRLGSRRPGSTTPEGMGPTEQCA